METLELEAPILDSPKAAPLYGQLADEFSALIRAGQLKTGERLPSVRRLSLQRRLSISTVLQALRLLETQGLVEARPQSGYFVRRPIVAAHEPEMSAPPRTSTYVGVNETLLQLLRSSNNKDSAPLGSAIPSPKLYPDARLQRMMSARARREPQLLSNYEWGSGLPAFRHEIARRYLEWGCTLPENEIVVTNGCIEAVHLALRAVAKPGDTIAIESPTYFGMLQLIESLQMKALEIPTHPREGISLDALDLALTRSGPAAKAGRGVKAVLVMPNFSNPLGSQMTLARKKALVALCARHEIPLIEDDIYGDLPFGPVRPAPLKSFDKTGNVILCSSLSKTLAPGMRLGWIAPGSRLPQIEALKWVHSATPPAIVQATLGEFLSIGGYDHHLRGLRRAFAEQVRQISDAVVEYFPEGTRITRPAGGFVLWVELPEDIDTLVLHKRAAKESIEFAPGPLFSASGRYRNCLRLNCGHAWSGKIERAVMRLGELAGQAAGKS